MMPDIRDSRHPWQRLVHVARESHAPEGAGVPHGFATRMAALAMSGGGVVESLVERFAWRALGVACLLAILSVALNYSQLVQRQPHGVEDVVLAGGNTLAVVLDLDLAD